MSRRKVAAALRRLAIAAAVAAALPAAASAEQASQPGVVAAGGLDVGRYHTCAVLPGGRLRCWGYGGDGQLGYANRSSIGDDETPAAAGPVDFGAGRSVLAVSAGDVHSCALLEGGSVSCWGFGGEGRLGYANTATIGDDEAPASAGAVDLGPGRTAKAVAAGRAHSCAVLDDGTVRCWGFAFDGRLGYGTQLNVGDDEPPGAVGPVRLGEGRSALAVSAGDSHTCALLDDGTVRCWGFGATGQLGYGNPIAIGDNETPDTVGPVKLGPGRVVALTAGGFHNCALKADGTVRCWGFGGNGRLGSANTDNIGDNETPDTVGPVDLGPGRKAVAIAAGADHTCAVLDDGTVRCWGFGGNGRLGYATKISIGDDETPGSAGPVDIGPGRRALAISAGGDSTCARLDDGSVRCWGEGANGRLGLCNTNVIGDDETPGTAGPVELGVPGSPGAGCPAAPPPAGAPPAEVAASGPPGPTPPRSVVRVPSLAPVAALAVQNRRGAALRACLRRVSRRAARSRRACLRRHGRTPGRVTTVAAKAAGRRRITLTFRSAGTESSKPPAARRYVIRQSRRPIRSARDFRRAGALCKGNCSFAVTEVGAKLTLKITDLRPRRTFYYAVVARDNVSGRTGRRSKTVSARTR